MDEDRTCMTCEHWRPYEDWHAGRCFHPQRGFSAIDHLTYPGDTCPKYEVAKIPDAD